MANQKRMTENAARRKGTVEDKGAVREGHALLQGLLLCGHCGGRVRVRYAGQDGKRATYCCMKLEYEGLAPSRCLSIAARNLETPIVEVVMSVLTHERLLDATRIVDLVEEQDRDLDTQWRLRVERARYDAKRVERQYDACDPENRVVARTLEKRWNEKLALVEELEREYEVFQHKQRAQLTDLDRQRILKLADDLPKLWSSPTTTNRDRKLLLRHLVKDIAVRRIDVPRSALRVQLLWHTNAITELEIELIGKGSATGRKPRPVAYVVLGTRASSSPAIQRT